MKSILEKHPHLADIIGIPPSFRTLSLESFNPNGLVSKGLTALKNGQSIYLHGDVGRGKSFVACYWALQWTIDRIPTGAKGAPRFVVAYEYFDALKESFDAGGTRAVQTPLLKCPLLVFDNYGRYPTEWSDGELFKLINHRYNEGMPIVITTTMPFDDFDERDPDSASRMCEMGIVLNLKGDDRRKQ